MATLAAMSVQTVTFQSERANLEKWRVFEAELEGPESGEVLIRIDHFALTANNITYGVAGDAVGYWQFFPAIFCREKLAAYKIPKEIVFLPLEEMPVGASGKPIRRRGRELLGERLRK